MENRNSRNSRFVSLLENVFEKFLWNSRLVILFGVFGLLIGATVVFFMGILETIALTQLFINNIVHHGVHFDEDIYNVIIVQIITTVDDFLLGIVLLIFGLGTYDLFISRIDPALDQEDIRPDWMVFESLDELKNVLGKVVLMILTINFFRLVVNMDFEKPVDLLYLGAGIAFVSLALKLSHSKDIDKSTLLGQLKEDLAFGKSIQREKDT